jgi:hypothetical protein
MAIQTAEQMVAALKKATAGAGSYGYTQQQLMDVTNPVLKSAQELANLYGFDYNQQNIYDTYKKSLDAGYAARYNQQAQTDATYYDNAAVAQNTLTDTLRQQQSQAILSGASKGMQAANALSAVLGTSQQFAANATQLAKDREQIGKEYATDYTNMGVKALDTYNALGNQLADISKNLYSSDTSRYVGQLDYNSAVNTANAQMAAQSMAAKAQYESAVANDVASIYQQYYTGQISLATAQKQAQASIQAAKVYGADAASITAAANKAVAASNYAATKYSTDANVAAQYGSAATTQKSNSANLLTSVIAGVTSGTLKPASAVTTLKGYLAAGLIDQGTYNSTVDLISGKQTVQLPFNIQGLLTPSTSSAAKPSTTASGQSRGTATITSMGSKNYTK